MGWHYGFRPYVPVARRRAKAAAHAARLAKAEKRALAPIKIEGRKIAASFWGEAWCDNLESYSDFDNRLPRGRTYVRNGSVVDLQIDRGVVKAIVSGSDVYTVKITIKTVPAAAWARIRTDCARSIDSLIDLLQGRFDQGIMRRLTEQDSGLFPRPDEIDMKCSCPDYAYMCKHIAAVLYGIGARLDTAPELLFTLRGVDHLELISQAVAADNLEQALDSQAAAPLAGADLGEIFGIDLDSTSGPVAQPAPRAAKKKTPQPTASQPTPARPTPARPTPARPSAAAKRRDRSVALPDKVKKALKAVDPGEKVMESGERQANRTKPRKAKKGGVAAARR